MLARPSVAAPRGQAPWGPCVTLTIYWPPVIGPPGQARWCRLRLNRHLALFRLLPGHDKIRRWPGVEAGLEVAAIGGVDPHEIDGGNAPCLLVMTDVFQHQVSGASRVAIVRIVGGDPV